MLLQWKVKHFKNNVVNIAACGIVYF